MSLILIKVNSKVTKPAFQSMSTALKTISSTQISNLKKMNIWKIHYFFKITIKVPQIKWWNTWNPKIWRLSGVKHLKHCFRLKIIFQIPSFSKLLKQIEQFSMFHNTINFRTWELGHGIPKCHKSHFPMKTYQFTSL